MGRLFGTDGIRGIANRDLSIRRAEEVGMALAEVIRGEHPEKRPTVVIGRDTRLSGEMLQAALAGGLSAFLIYNFHPAKVFMGDTGSLFLGGAVCGLAFALDVPLVIPLVGLIYVLETLSDIIQVIYFKATHGKRFFRMAPLHHHLELGGWSETKLFCVFSGATLVLCVLAFLGVMNRYPM